MKSLAVHQGNSRDPANPVKSLRRERESERRNQSHVDSDRKPKKKRRIDEGRETKMCGGKDSTDSYYLFIRQIRVIRSARRRTRLWFSNRRASLLSSLFVGPLQTAEYSSDPISFCSAQHSIILRASVADDIKNHFPSPPSQNIQIRNDAHLLCEDIKCCRCCWLAY